MAADIAVVGEPPAPSPQRSRARQTPWAMGGLVAAIGLACGISPFAHGFYSLSTWGVLALVTLAVAWGIVVGGDGRLSGLPLAALLALVALAAISLLSTAWAESVDNALTATGRWILYASTFAIVLLGVRSGRVARVGIAAVSAGVLVMAAYILGVMVTGDGASLFQRGRLNDPLGYINTQGLFPVLGVWPLIGLAQYARPIAAGLAAAGATVLMGVALLSQSRSVALAFIVAAVAVLLLVPGRQRRAWLLLLVLGGVAAVNSPLLHVYDLGRHTRVGLDDAASRAAWWIVLAAGGVGLIWAAVVAAERRFGTPQLRRASAVALGAVVLAGVGVAGVRAGHLRSYVHDQVHAFTALQSNIGPSRLISAGGNRYDFWRIAAHEFAHHPLGGRGAGNYTRDYFLLRRTTDDVRQPHSIEFQTLAELGIFGTLALAVFLGAVALGALRHLRAGAIPTSERVLLTGTIGVFAAWLVHASVDWSHLVPGAMGIALIAGAYLLTRPAADGQRFAAPRPRAATIAAAVLVTLGVAVGATVVGRLTLADHYLNQGKGDLATNPVRAIQKANDSLAFESDSLEALYLKSAGYARLGDYQRGRAALLRATKIEPHNFVPWALLGDLAARRDALDVARMSYARASRLNPRDPTLKFLRRQPQPQS